MKIRLCLGFCLLSLFSGTVFSEQQFKEPSVRKQKTRELKAKDVLIEEIVVNATRRQQTLTELALSVSVLNRDALALTNADHPAEVLGQLAGVNLHRGSGAEHITAIRSPVLTGGAGAGSFLYLQDGVPLRAAGFGNTNGLLGTTSELAEQIEVIRGPSGPIYGANAVHGVINVVTPKPEIDADKHLEGDLALTADSQARYKAQTKWNGTTSAHGWFSGLSLTKENGYRDNAGIDEQKGLFRHVHLNGNTEIDSIVSVHNLNQETAGFIFGEEALKDRDLRKQNDVPFAYRDVKSLLLQTNISRFETREQGSETGFKLTPFARWHEMEFLQHFLPSQAVEKNGHWSVGLQSDFSLRTANWNLLTGLDLDYTQGELNEYQANPTIFSYTQGLHYDYEVNATSLSAFAQLDYQLSEKWKAITGLRLDHTQNEYHNRTDDGIVGRFLRPADRTDTFTTSSPKLALQYQQNANLMSYLSVARAHRPPQTSDLYRLQQNQTEDSAKAEKMDSLELGWKYHIDDAFSANVAIFAMKKDNYFFRDADGFNVNNGRTQHRGIELDLESRISESVTLATAITYARHSYDFDRTVARDYELIERGNDIDSAPRTMANTRLHWTPNEKVDLSLHWVMMGKYFTDAANLHSYAGHDVYHLRARYQFKPGLQLGLAIRNLSDELYAERADFAFGQERYFPAETRTISLSLMMQF